VARGTPLVGLLNMLRDEARLSRNPAHNVQTRDSQVSLLQRVQSRLWDDFAWPHMRVEREQPLQAGQAIYAPPSDMRVERIERLDVFTDSAWRPLAFGIGAAELSTYNTTLDERAYPPRRYQIAENEDIQLWPIPDQSGDEDTREGYLKITGIRDLRPLVADTDTCDLDDQMIVLYAAAELLAAAGAKDAQLKLESANRIYARKRGGLTQRHRFTMFGTGLSRSAGRPAIGRYRPPV
jgi:hypothetical protein